MIIPTSPRHRHLHHRTSVATKISDAARCVARFFQASARAMLQTWLPWTLLSPVFSLSLARQLLGFSNALWSLWKNFLRFGSKTQLWSPTPDQATLFYSAPPGVVAGSKQSREIRPVHTTKRRSGRRSLAQAINWRPYNLKGLYRQILSQAKMTD